MKRHNFKELHIWQLGMDIVDEIYDVTMDYPKEELFGLSLQMRKAAVSIPSNITEGCGRGTDPQLVQFLNIAQGSAFELETQVYIAIRRKYADVKTSHKERLASASLVSGIKREAQIKRGSFSPLFICYLTK